MHVLQQMEKPGRSFRCRFEMNWASRLKIFIRLAHLQAEKRTHTYCNAGHLRLKGWYTYSGGRWRIRLEELRVPEELCGVDIKYADGFPFWVRKVSLPSSIFSLSTWSSLLTKSVWKELWANWEAQLDRQIPGNLPSSLCEVTRSCSHIGLTHNLFCHEACGFFGRR
jgi:hypothetical protein